MWLIQRTIDAIRDDYEAKENVRANPIAKVGMCLGGEGNTIDTFLPFKPKSAVSKQVSSQTSAVFADLFQQDDIPGHILSAMSPLLDELLGI